MFHTFDICERIAEKLSASDKIADAFRSNPVSAEQWSERSLANGWPSLALLYSVLDIHFPHKNYDHIAHNYLKRCTTDLQGSGTFSLLHGLAGLCITTYFCSKEGDRYRHLLTQLDKLLVDKLELYLNLPEKESYPFHVYNRMHGISGVLAYLSLRQNDSVLQFYAKRCLSHLVAFINQNVTVFNHHVPGWYESPETLYLPGDKEKYPNGKFSLGQSGVSDVLSVLSIMALEGIWVEGLREAIFSLSDWLKKKKRESAHGPTWPHAISLEEETGEQENAESPTSAWVMGTPLVSRSLYLASKVLNDRALKAFAEDALLQFFKSNQEERLTRSSLATGKAGVLAITYWMSRDTGSPFLFKKVNELENGLKSMFNPQHPFGFQSTISMTENSHQSIDDPGLANGACGALLSLLLAQDKKDPKWERIFFMR